MIRIHKVLKLFLSILLGVAMVSGCAAGREATEAPQETERAQTPPEATEIPEPAASSEQTPNAAATPEQSPEIAPADRKDAVLNRDEDAGKLTARFLDIVTLDSAGQRKKTGDHILLTSPDGKLMLIDTGTPTAGPLLVQMLEDMGITYIDYLVISHTHADHIGGAPSVLANFEFGQIYMNHDTRDEYGGSYYSAMMQEILRYNIPYTLIHEGYSFQFGENVQVTVYNPPEGYDYLALPEGVETRNSSSLALRFVYNESSFLFCGDIYSGAEQRLVERYGSELASGLVKMNHHGYDASNTLAWVRAVSPKIAVATFGADIGKNLAYQSVGARTFFTFADGSLRISTAGDGKYEVLTQLDRQLTTLGGEMSADGRYLID